MCCNALQCAAVYCSVLLQSVAVKALGDSVRRSVLQYNAVCYIVLCGAVAECCNKGPWRAYIYKCVCVCVFLCIYIYMNMSIHTHIWYTSKLTCVYEKRSRI